MSNKALKPGVCDWEIRARDLHADCRVFSVLRKTCFHPRRRAERDFFAIRSADWVNVLAVTPEEELVVINQFRFGVEECALEIPGGMIDEGEDPLVAGVRELEEETGFVGENARVIGSVWPNPAILDNRCSFVLVENAVRKGELCWDQDEEIEVRVEKIDTVLRWAREGTIRHALVLNALFLLEPIWAEMRNSAEKPD